MSRCLPRERSDAEAFADGLLAHTHVESVEIRCPSETASDRFELDVRLAPQLAGTALG
jgi:hypothetical protein